MPTLIKHRRIVENHWRTIMDEETIPIQGDILISWSRWIAEKNALLTRTGGRYGVVINGDVDVAELIPHLASLPIIALEFPTFTDGRCYSHAAILRQLGYDGELRAVGDVLRDQLSYMERVGIDAFDFSGGRNEATAALAAFTEFSVHYQNVPARHLPRLRRRERLAA